MLRWLWDTLIWTPRCEHDWELLARAQKKIWKDTPDNVVKNVPYWLYRCKKCGKFNQHEITEF